MLLYLYLNVSLWGASVNGTGFFKLQIQLVHCLNLEKQLTFEY